ncbi:phage holin family protein [Histidinibacterium lentulum]|uniref:Phage holin family protein n=2 Tax=Histidinibacterium lentulum TaxID=2480588 RepID=A0A3N2R8W8_9RHOB|nr:phage holin family protein [Histidinibacterium lentulum]
MHRERTTGESSASLLSEALTRATSLFRKEIDLARAELDSSLQAAFLGIGLIVAAVVISLTALNVLSAALVAALVEAGLETGWASLAVGVAFAVIAAILAMMGARKLKSVTLGPQRVADNVKADVAMVRERVSD